MKRYTIANRGCYGDGAHGHQHVRNRLAHLVAELGRINQDRIDLIASLQGPMPDDASDEDYALDLLCADACAESCMFVLDSGDLLLVSTDESEVTP